MSNHQLLDAEKEREDARNQENLRNAILAELTLGVDQTQVALDEKLKQMRVAEEARANAAYRQRAQASIDRHNAKRARLEPESELQPLRPEDEYKDSRDAPPPPHQWHQRSYSDSYESEQKYDSDVEESHNSSSFDVTPDPRANATLTPMLASRPQVSPLRLASASASSRDEMDLTGDAVAEPTFSIRVPPRPRQRQAAPVRETTPPPPPPPPPPADDPRGPQPERRQDLLRLRRLEIALRDANNFPNDTKIIDWPRLRSLREPLRTNDVLLCFVRCRYVVARAWARLTIARQQTLMSMIQSQQGVTFFVQMTQFFRQMSRLVASQRYLTRAQLAELDLQHRKAASFFEEDFSQPADVLPPRVVEATNDADDTPESRRILLNPSFHAALVIGEACSQPGALRKHAQAHWELSEQLEGSVATAVNAAFAEIKTWYDWHLRVAPGDLTKVLKDEQALPRFAEFIALLAARERLAFNRRPVPVFVSELINLRTAHARQWLQAYHSTR